MNRLLIIKASWKQIFEDILSAFSIIYLSYIILRFFTALIFAIAGRTMFKYKVFNTPIFVISFAICIIAYYRGGARARELINDIIFKRIKQTDAIFLDSIKCKIFVTTVYRITLKIKKKKYLHLYCKTPLDIAAGTKINLYYSEKSLIIIIWKTM